MSPYTVRKVRLSGAYETGTGRYFGANINGSGDVYQVIDRDSEEDILTLRAHSRPQALHRVRACFKESKRLGTSMRLVPEGWY
jgi:hypothetical protein